MARTLLPASLVCLLVIATGCASKPSVSSWQGSVNRYVRDKGDGDPTILREMTLPDGRRGFSIIEHHDKTQSTDVNGLLLGHERAAGRLWLVYLVGVVPKERVREMRLVAVSMDAGKTVWKRGPKAEPSFKRYRDHGLKQAKERFPERKDPPPRYTGFPRPDDVFTLSNRNGNLIATHEASGARWGLALVEKKN